LSSQPIRKASANSLLFRFAFEKRSSPSCHRAVPSPVLFGLLGSILPANPSCSAHFRVPAQSVLYISPPSFGPEIH